MIGYVFATLGYPFCVALNASLYSKVLGDIPQVQISIEHCELTYNSRGLDFLSSISSPLINSTLYLNKGLR